MKMSNIYKALPLMEMEPSERRLVEFVLLDGKRGCWTNFQGSNLAQVFALHMDWSTTTIKRALRALERRKWLMIGQDFNGRHLVKLTLAFQRDAEIALVRRQVRSACGPDMWARLKGDNALADQLRAMVDAPEDDPFNNPKPLQMKAALRKAGQKVYRDRKAKEAATSGVKLAPARGQTGPS